MSLNFCYGDIKYTVVYTRMYRSGVSVGVETLESPNRSRHRESSDNSPLFILENDDHN